MAAPGYLKFTIKPTGAGKLDFRYRDGDDSGAAPPLQPTLSTPVVLSSSSMSLALAGLASGGVPPYTYELERSSVSSSSGFAQIASGAQTAVFSSNDLYVDTGLSAATQYWYRLRVTDSDNPVRTSLYSTPPVTNTTAAVVGDTTAPTAPTVATDPFTSTTTSGTTFTLLTAGTDDVAVVDLSVGYGLATGVTSPTSGTPVAGTWTDLILNRPVASGLSFDIPGQAGQSYYVRGNGRDAALNVSPASPHRYITLPDPPAGGTALFELPLSTATTLAGASLFPISRNVNDPTFSTTHARIGGQSLRFYHEWANTTPGSQEGDREEVVVMQPPYSTTDNSNFPFGAEWYYGWSIYLPLSYPVDEFQTILMQFHQYGGTLSAPSPPFHLTTSNQTDRFLVGTRYQRADNTLAGYLDKDAGPVVRGKWVDFRMRVKWHDVPANAALQVQKRVPADSAAWTDIPFPEVGTTRGSCFKNSTTQQGPELKHGCYVYHQNRVSYPDYTPSLSNQVHEMFWGYSKMSIANGGTFDLVTPSGVGF